MQQSALYKRTLVRTPKSRPDRYYPAGTTLQLCDCSEINRRFSPPFWLPLLAEAPLALGSGAGLRWRRKLASDEVADEYTVLPSCMHFGGTSATLSLSLTRDPIFFLADPSNQSPAFSATHPGHWDKLRGGHELVSFFTLGSRLQ